MTVEVPSSTSSKTSSYTLAMIFLVLLGGGVVSCFRDGHRQLSDLTRATGTLHDAVIRKTRGKNAYYYLAFSVSASPQTFGIRARDSEQPLAQLQQSMQQGSELTVYYDSPRWVASETNFEVYQVAQRGRVVYSIEEVHQRALNHGAWALVAWFILAVLMLGQYLQRTFSIPKS
jgi:hypothetical protein